MEDLKKYLSEHKDQLDVYDPPKDLWKKIHRDLESRKPARSFTFLRVAAAVFLILFTAVLFRTISINNESNQQSKWEVEMNEIDVHYTSMINQKLNELEAISGIEVRDKEEIYAFMDELDEELIDLKEYLKDELDNEKVLEALINHYRKRIDILEAIMDRLDLLNSQTQQNGEITL